MNGDYMRTEQDYNQSNYDLEISPYDIAVNIDYINTTNINEILDKATPLSKKIHLHMNTGTDEYGVQGVMKTKLSMKNGTNRSVRIL